MDDVEDIEQESEDIEPEVVDDEGGDADVEQEPGGDDEDSDEGEDSEIIVSIGEESPPQPDDNKAPEWVRELRKSHRETQKENRELKAKLDELTNASSKPVELGKKPSLESCDYDSDKYDRELLAWYERKQEHDKAEAERAEEQRKQEQEWQSRLDDYAAKKAELKVRDYDDAEAYIEQNFSQVQQGMVLQGADNPALVFYALGKNPKKADELSKIKDPVKFAFAVAKLETQLKVTNRKAATKPERTVSGSARVSGSVDSTLERLRAEASRTGDFSKLTAYKRKLKAKK